MCQCKECVNHAAFNEGRGKGGDYGYHALCYIFGIDVYPESRGCEYWEKNPKLARKPENTPKVPSVGELGVALKEKCNEHDYSTKLYKCIIRTAEVYGKWYGGHSFGVKTGSMFGSGCAPCIHCNGYPDEQTCIQEELKRVLWAAEHNCREMPDVAQGIKAIMMEARQLALF